MAINVDKFDLQILEALLADGRMSHEKIASGLELSRPTVHNRVKELQRNGIIKNYTTVIDWEKLGYGIDAFILLRLETTDFNETIRKILAMSTSDFVIEKVYRVTGENCIMLRIKAHNTSEIRVFHDALLQKEGVIETNTMFILQEEGQLPSF